MSTEHLLSRMWNLDRVLVSGTIKILFLFSLVLSGLIHSIVGVTADDSLEVIEDRKRLMPTSRIGEIIGDTTNGHRYQLTEFVRIQGDEPHPEKHQIDEVFFTPALEWHSLKQLPEPSSHPLEVVVDTPSFDQNNHVSLSIVSPESSKDSSENTKSSIDVSSVTNTDIISENPIQNNEQIESVSKGKELNSLKDIRGSWRLKQRTNRGANGEVWRGTRVTDSKDGDGSKEGQVFILKRMLLEKGDKIRLAAAREAFFGKLMWASEFSGHVGRFVESFTNEVGGEWINATELWLVFVDEGISLHEWLYTPVDFSGGSMLLPSEAWRRMRTSKHGKAQIQELLRQVFASALALHSSNITHRDIKTSNVVWRVEANDDNVHGSRMDSSLFVVLIDFSSAFSQDALKSGLFGTEGPCEDEETRETIPPERFFADSPLTPAPSYDTWAIGVLMLELLLGTQSVFTVDQRTRALLTWKLKAESQQELEKALFRAALSDFCIIETPHKDQTSETHNNDKGDGGGLGCEWTEFVQEEACGLTEFADALQRRDPLELGYLKTLGMEGLDLLSKLLKWHPEERISAQEALDHPFLRTTTATPSPLDGLLSSSRLLPTPSSSLNQEDHFEDLSLLPPEPSSKPEFIISDKFDVGPYKCPRCGRVFDLYHSCLQHALMRRHALWCDIADDETLTPLAPGSELVKSEATSPSNTPESLELLLPAPSRPKLPRCLSSHSFLPDDKLSGWCDVQGRRAYLEDHCGVVYAPDYIIWSVFDGHMKASAAQFAAHYLPSAMARHIALDRPTIQQVEDAFLETDRSLLADQAIQFQKTQSLPLSKSMIEHALQPKEPRIGSENTSQSSNWVRLLLGSIIPQKFQNAVSNFLFDVWSPSPSKSSTTTHKSVKDSPNASRSPGTTATTAMVTKSGYLIVANVGDSRAVLCCAKDSAVPLSRDHIASDEKEAQRVESLGAKIIWGHGDEDRRGPVGEEEDGKEEKEKHHNKDRRKLGLARVNGEVAVTRSFGDASLKKYLIAKPHITILNLKLASKQTQTLESYSDSRPKQRPSHNLKEKEEAKAKEVWNITSDGSGSEESPTPSSSSSSSTSLLDSEDERPSFEFLIVATDGLWDVMTSQEAVDYVKARRLKQNEDDEVGRKEKKSTEEGSTCEHSRREQMTWQQVATALTHEALLRGSLDNVGVCVIDLKNRIPWFSL